MKLCQKMVFIKENLLLNYGRGGFVLKESRLELLTKNFSSEIMKIEGVRMR